jgi:PAS domain S-box-containing protein
MIEYYEKSLKKRSALDLGELELRFMNRNGKYIWVSVVTKNYVDEDGKIVGWITSLRDITKRKNMEKKLRAYMK